MAQNIPDTQDDGRLSQEEEQVTPTVKQAPGSTVVLDADEAVARLSTKYDVPPKAKKLFGPLNIKALYEIVNDPAMLQIDALVQRGELSYKEAHEYIMVLPEYDALRMKIAALAKSMVGALKNSGAIRSAVRKSSPSLQTARQGRGFKPGKELNELMFAIYDLCSSQEVRGVDSFRNGWLLRLRKAAFDLLALEVLIELRKKDYSVFDREIIDEVFFCAWRDMCKANKHLSFTGDVLKDMKAHLENLLKTNKKEFSSLLEGHVKSCGGDAKCTEKYLAEDNQLLFAEIKEQSQSKEIPASARNFGAFTLEIPIEFSKSMHQEALTVVTLHFGDMSEYKRIYLGKTMDKCGSRAVAQAQSPLSFEFILDRSTGDLCYSLTKVPVSYSMDTRQYLLFKNLVFYFVTDCLEERQDPMIERLGNVRTDINECLTGEGLMNGTCTNGGGDFMDSDKNVIKMLSEHPAANDEEEDTRTEEEIWDEEWKICRYRARGKTGRIILAAIKRILKREPIRIMGSHIIFEGDNGRRCPIPIHPSETMALGSLKNFLITLEISPLALAEEL